MIFCKKCGQKLEEGREKCSNCGEIVNVDYEQQNSEIKNEELNGIENIKQEKTASLLNSEFEKNITDKDFIDDTIELKQPVFKSIIRSKKSKIIFFSALAIFLILGSIFFINYTKAEKAKEQLNLGNKYLEEGNYEGAILAFNKVIKSEPKNIEAMVGLANAYIKLKKLDKAEEILLKAREIEKMNADVLLLLSELWKEKKPKDLYEAINEYMKQAVAPNINEKIKKIYDDMISAPPIPKASLPSGKYTEQQSITVSAENMKPGNYFYYTLDGSEPGKNNGTIYTEPVFIGNGHTILKIVSVNVMDAFGEKVSLEYEVNIKYKDKIIEMIKEAEQVYDNSQEGREEGKYPKGSKAVLLQSIQPAQEIVNKKNSTQNEVDIKLSELSNQLNSFRQKKISKSKPVSLILKNTKRPSISTGAGDVLSNELWVKYSDGKEELVVSSKPDKDLQKQIAQIYDPQFTRDKKKVYFWCGAWAVSGAIHVVDIETKSEHFVCDGNYLKVIQSGEYCGYLIVSQHRYKKGGGSYDHYYILNEQGTEIKDLGNSEEVLNEY